ncbi:hypothetical protein Air01nite_29690 [Asanoa iriomotensis]|uniref:Uncharacterized protein n=1 Tax=Asanoa iriomotensis TaxID=234613 RepID=A0ABQ4C2A2_9ACTN|nr:hypothetical protein Air01nite_29690 [Asanoa iriomotensis]
MKQVDAAPDGRSGALALRSGRLRARADACGTARTVAAARAPGAKPAPRPRAPRTCGPACAGRQGAGDPIEALGYVGLRLAPQRAPRALSSRAGCVNGDQRKGRAGGAEGRRASAAVGLSCL